MSLAHIGLCHRNALFSECLALSLSNSETISCSMISPFTAILPGCFSQSPFKLLLLDGSLPEELTERVLKELRRVQPSSKILFLISESAVGRIVELARFGVDGFSREEVTLAGLRSAIDLVLSGTTFCSPELANALLAQIGRNMHDGNWSQQLDSPLLSDREREVLELIALQRLSNKQIARRLGISLYTVKNHVHNIIKKLAATDRHEAVEIARLKNLLVVGRDDCRRAALSQ